MEYTDIELEIANDRKLKKARRQSTDIQYLYGAAATIKPSSDISIEDLGLDSMTKVEEPGLIRYSNMPVIEFTPTIGDLKAQRKLVKAINRANNTTEKLKERIKVAHGQRQNTETINKGTKRDSF